MDCKEKDCLCNDGIGRQCGYSLKERGTVYVCTKVYGHSDRHHSCGNLKEWYSKESLVVAS